MGNLGSGGKSTSIRDGGTAAGGNFVKGSTKGTREAEAKAKQKKLYRRAKTKVLSRAMEGGARLGIGPKGKLSVKGGK
jgi:hypothetical protein